MKNLLALMITLISSITYAQDLENLEYATPKSISGGAIMSFVYNNEKVDKLFYDFYNLHFVSNANVIKSTFNLENDYISLFFWLKDDVISIAGYDKAVTLKINSDGSVKILNEIEYRNLQKRFKKDFGIKKKDYSKIARIESSYLCLGKEKRFLIKNDEVKSIDFTKFDKNKSKYAGAVWAINEIYILEDYIVHHDNNFEGFVLHNRNTDKLTYQPFPDSHFTNFIVDRKRNEFYFQEFEEDGSNVLKRIDPVTLESDIISKKFPHLVSGILDGHIYYKEVFDESQGHYLTDFKFTSKKSMLLDSVEMKNE